MAKKIKYTVSSDFVYAENKKTYISLKDGNDNLYKISGAGPLIAKKIQTLKEFDLESLHEELNDLFEIYDNEQRALTEEFISSLIKMSILVKVADS